MIDSALIRISSRLAFSGLLALALLAPSCIFPADVARADDPVALSITIKDHKFDPPELHASAGVPVAIRVKNLNDTPSEFESSDLHFEKIVPVGKEGAVYVRPQQPGRYKFYDDFHHDTQGFLVVQ